MLLLKVYFTFYGSSFFRSWHCVRSALLFRYSGFALILRCDRPGMVGRSAEDLPGISPTSPTLNCSGSAFASVSAGQLLGILSGCALSLSLLLSVSASLILSGCGSLPRSVPAGCLPSGCAFCSSLSGPGLCSSVASCVRSLASLRSSSPSLRLCAPGRSLRTLSASFRLRFRFPLYKDRKTPF